MISWYLAPDTLTLAKNSLLRTAVLLKAWNSADALGSVLCGRAARALAGSDPDPQGPQDPRMSSVSRPGPKGRQGPNVRASLGRMPVAECG